jgi:hypothetical protein
MCRPQLKSSLVLSRYVLSISAVAALLAGCGGSQPPIGAPGAMLQTTIAVRAGQRSGFGPSSVSAKSGIYVSENLSSGLDVFGYANNNRSNGPPVCSENASSTYDLAVDGKSNLIVPEYNTITVFKGPTMCGQELGSFHTIWDDDYPVDATSPDAATGTIAVGVIQDAGSGVGSIELCTLKSGCKTNLTNGSAMNLVFAVAMSMTVGRPRQHRQRSRISEAVQAPDSRRLATKTQTLAASTLTRTDTWSPLAVRK